MLPRRALAIALLMAILLPAIGPGIAGAHDATPAPGPPSASGPFDSIVQINGQDMHVACAGSGSPTVLQDIGGPDPAGGTAQLAQMGNDVADYLGTRFCMYDRAGAGQSAADPKGVRTLADSAADLIAVLAMPALGCPCVVIGESLGGSISLIALATDPSGFGGLVLLDAPYPGFWDELIRLAPAGSAEAGLATDPYFAGENEELLNMSGGFHEFTGPIVAPGIPIVVFVHGSGAPPPCFPCSDEYPVDQYEAAWQAGEADLAESLGARLIVVPEATHFMRENAGDLILDQTIEVIAAVRDPSTWATPEATPAS